MDKLSILEGLAVPALVVGRVNKSLCGKVGVRYNIGCDPEWGDVRSQAGRAGRYAGNAVKAEFTGANGRDLRRMGILTATTYIFGLC